MANSAPFTILYVGSFTGNQISVYFVQKSTLLLTQQVVSGYTPTWITYNQNVLYTTNELTGYVASLSVSQADGSLALVDRTDSAGLSPTFITISPAGDFLLAANYDSGSDAVFVIRPNGSFGRRTDFEQHTGSGPVPDRQTGPHAHQIIFEKSGKVAYSADLGADKVYQYHFTPGTGQLTALDVPFVTSDPGDGPRHLAFHPNGIYAYLACELSSAVITFQIQANGELKRLQKIPTLPTVQSNNFPAEILVYPNGNFVYVSNRGNDSISIFSVNQTDGTLRLMDVHSVYGVYPRGMVLDTATNIIFTTNQGSGTITAHSVDPATGALSYLGISATGLTTPVCGYILHIN
jgi:6-phosphogluconolactonase